MHLPDVVTAIGVAETACQEVPVGGLSYVKIVEPSVCGFPVYWVVFVSWFAVEAGFWGFAIVIGGDLFVVGFVEAAVARLEHVEVEPSVVVEPFGGGVVALGVVGHEVFAGVCLLYAVGHCTPDCFFVVCEAVAAEYPDYVGVVLVAVTYESAEGFCVLFVEYYRAFAPCFCDFVAPGWEHAYVDAFFFCAVYDEVHVLEVFGVGFGRVVVDEGFVAVGVGGIEAVEFGEDDCLNDGETYPASVFEIAFGFEAVEAVEEFPRGVAKVEKRRTVGVDNESFVLVYPEWAM